jgi:hypothetical protein
MASRRRFRYDLAGIESIGAIIGLGAAAGLTALMPPLLFGVAAMLIAAATVLGVS